MSNGYSHNTVRSIEQADSGLVGVALGQVCVRRNIPVAEVAQLLGVSRQTVYSWFAGRHSPRGDVLYRLKALTDQFSLADK